MALPAQADSPGRKSCRANRSDAARGLKFKPLPTNMTNPHPTPPRFQPVPAAPIVIKSHQSGYTVMVDGREGSGVTVQAAIEASKKEQSNAK